MVAIYTIVESVLIDSLNYTKSYLKQSFIPCGNRVFLKNYFLKNELPQREPVELFPLTSII
jgi:hypothetical protein